MKTSLAVTITQTAPVNLHKKQHAAFSVWKHKVGDRKSKSRRGQHLCCLCMDAASLRLHRTVICVLSGSQLGVMWSGLGSAPVGPRPWLSAGGRGFVPCRGRLKHLLGVDKFRLLWVSIQQFFLIGNCDRNTRRIKHY